VLGTSKKIKKLIFVMEKERKIKAVVKKVSFAEAENADDEYWAKASAEERLQDLIRLRAMVYGNIIDTKIKKVVFKRSIHEEEN
jgi:hypothetical protein